MKVGSTQNHWITLDLLWLNEAVSWTGYISHGYCPPLWEFKKTRVTVAIGYNDTRLSHPLWGDVPSSHMSDRCRCRHQSQGSWSTWRARQHLDPYHCVHSSLFKITQTLCLGWKLQHNDMWQNQIRRLFSTCPLIKVFVVDDDTLSHALVAHLILECWRNNSVMAFRTAVLLPHLAILILLTGKFRKNKEALY